MDVKAKSPDPAWSNSFGSVGRLIGLSRHRGSENMAMDDAICQHVADGEQPPTLRFYQWQRPTLSLGYFQAAADAEAWAIPEVDTVRRCTGGGAILHHHELTYSLCLPLIDQKPGARNGVYLAVHQVIEKVLAEFGVTSMTFASYGKRAPYSDQRFLCFQRRSQEDLVCAGYKILGSAQRRIRGGLLQHGSLLLSASPFAAELPGIQQLTPGELPLPTFVRVVSKRLAQVLNLQWRDGELSGQELTASEEIARRRYASDDWTRRR